MSSWSLLPSLGAKIMSVPSLRTWLASCVTCASTSGSSSSISSSSSASAAALAARAAAAMLSSEFPGATVPVSQHDPPLCCCCCCCLAADPPQRDDSLDTIDDSEDARGAASSLFGEDRRRPAETAASKSAELRSDSSMSLAFSAVTALQVYLVATAHSLWMAAVAVVPRFPEPLELRESVALPATTSQSAAGSELPCELERL
mmetsp:Transcript_17521/g.53409  ORF Transcript_17521/g.53409 Transcript_17521/m.53409 type:complete len:203 (-) Transcript_17521:1111-1719(-)